MKIVTPAELVPYVSATPQTTPSPSVVFVLNGPVHITVTPEATTVIEPTRSSWFSRGRHRRGGRG
jgi:hypothetical protein